jgi:formate C-acetyltransferase
MYGVILEENRAAKLTDEEVRQIINKIKEINVLTPRVKRRLKEWEEAPVLLSSYASVAFTESWKETEGEPLTLGWAKAFARIMEKAPVIIFDHELIVGSHTKYLRGSAPIAAIFPKRVLKALEEGVIDNKMGVGVSFVITNDERKLLEEDARYWAERVNPDFTNALRKEILGEDHLDLLMDRAMIMEGMACRADTEFECGLFGWGFCIGDVPQVYGIGGPSSFRLKVIHYGLNYIIEEAKKVLDKIEKEGAGLPKFSQEASEKYILAKAIIIACEAVIKWAKRYAELARRMADVETDPIRKEELKRIAEVCEWVPANPPRNFWEALQSAHFLRTVLFIENPCPRESPVGRLDVELWPYYKNDLIKGNLTREQAAELLALFWIKTRSFESFDPQRPDVRPAPGTLLPNITIGGADENGDDVTNELSCLILEVMRQLKLSEPAVYIRWHKGMSDEFLIYALECNRDYGGGNPAFLNDELGTRRFLERGVPAKDAVDWKASGCLGYNLESCFHVGGAFNLNLTKIFEITLYNGFDPRTGKQIGLQTGDVTKFTSIDQLIDAFLEQVDYFAKKMRMDIFVVLSAARLNYPIVSGLSAAMQFQYTLPAGRSIVNGASPYPDGVTIWMADRGTTDVADSLAAIKFLVFDQKKITMKELLEALKNNWEGFEDIRQLCLNAPKYGNDDPYVDTIHTYIWKKTQETFQKRPDPFTGRKPFTFKGAAIGHIVHGRVVGALPNGRKAYTPINDGATSAMPGADKNGPTALIKSATKVSYKSLMGGPLNMKLNKSMLYDREKLEKISALIKTFFQRGGWHIQFNIVSAEELLAAKKDPEKYKHLIVRVAGYSAYFVDLPASVQDEIISRTLHEI